MYAIPDITQVNVLHGHLWMYFVRCQPNCSALFVGLGPRLWLEQLVRFNPQYPGDPHDRVEGRVRLAAFDVADECPTDSGSVGEIGLGQPQREPEVADVATQRSPDAPLCFFKGLKSCHDPSANPSRPAHSGGGRRSANYLPRPGGSGYGAMPEIKDSWSEMKERQDCSGPRRTAYLGDRPVRAAARRHPGAQELAFVPESLNLAAVKGIAP